MKNIKILFSFILLATICNAQSSIQTTGILQNRMAHFSGSTYKTIADSVSLTNVDSISKVNIGAVGTLADSLGDSTFVPIQFASQLKGGQLCISFAADFSSDTLCDSIIGYENAPGSQKANAVLFRFRVPTTTANALPQSSYGWQSQSAHKGQLTCFGAFYITNNS